MPSKKNFVAELAAAAIIALLSVLPAQAIDFTNVAFAQVAEKRASVPVGHSEYCKVNRADCGPNRNVTDAEVLTDALWASLVNINAHFNQVIVPITDQDHYGVEELWTVPTNGYGDCEDYVLAKRLALIEAGWPASTLLISVVRQKSGEGHAVLMVRTDRGDLVLDNQDGTIRLWTDTPYQYLKRQSQQNSAKWVDIVDNRVTIVASN